MGAYLPQLASTLPSSSQCSSAWKFGSHLNRNNFVNLPRWKFHENASLPFQVFGAGASRARLHRNLPTSFHLESFQNIDWLSHSEAMSQFKTFCSPQFSNQDSTWVCPCRPCHRHSCLGCAPCQAGLRGRCSYAGTWTTCSCVFVELMELVLKIYWKVW